MTRPILLGLLFALAFAPHQADAERPRLALVMDDIGWDMRMGQRVLALPGPITVAVLPGTPMGHRLAQKAYGAGVEIILHQPMTAMLDMDPGPGSLVPGMDASTLRLRLAQNLDEIPHHVGVSNHMGSLLTRCETSMAAVMAELAGRGLYFLDSRTTHYSIALEAAQNAQVPATRRDVFLDNILDTGAIERALETAVAMAEARGHAVAIGHPHRLTLEVLEAQLPGLLERIELVPVSALLPARNLTKLAAGS